MCIYMHIKREREKKDICAARRAIDTNLFPILNARAALTAADLT